MCARRAFSFEPFGTFLDQSLEAQAHPRFTPKESPAPPRRGFSLKRTPSEAERTAAAGLKTVGEVREVSDATLLSLQDLGQRSVAHLRKTLGSTSRVRPVS
jgi:hypothetical protein